VAPKAHINSRRETEVDWEQARRFVRQCLSSRLRRGDDADIDDLCQDALVRLVRAIRREEVHNLEALMNVIAQRTLIDFLQKRRRWNILLEVEQVEAAARDRHGFTATPADLPGDPQGRVEFVVLEFFAGRSPNCHELARAFFRDRAWPTVASKLGLSHDAVRARWTRCLRTLRAALGQDPGLAPLAEWAPD
jgi:RNA polymerase sigma factor (sigma-70 family)